MNGFVSLAVPTEPKTLFGCAAAADDQQVDEGRVGVPLRCPQRSLRGADLLGMVQTFVHSALHLSANPEEVCLHGLLH